MVIVWACDWRDLQIHVDLSMFGTSKLWLMLGVAALLAVAAIVVRFADIESGMRKEVYVNSRHWVSQESVQGVQLIYYPSNPKCDFDIRELVQTVAQMSGAVTVHSLPKDGIVFVVTFNCGLTRSTLYYLPVSFEMWVSICYPAAESACQARTVFGFTHPLGMRDWACAKDIIRQELLNDTQRDTTRDLGLNCP